MTLEELELVCAEAARELVGRGGRPLPAVVVLPQPGATQLIELPDFPPDDAGRSELLAALAADRLRPVNAPCYGFVAEATLDTGAGPEPLDVIVIAFGARGHPPRVSAAVLEHDGLGQFSDAEPLDAAALPFIAPLQRAVDAAQPPLS